MSLYLPLPSLSLLGPRPLIFWPNTPSMPFLYAPLLYIPFPFCLLSQCFRLFVASPKWRPPHRPFETLDSGLVWEWWDFGTRRRCKQAVRLPFPLQQEAPSPLASRHPKIPFFSSHSSSSHRLPSFLLPYSSSSSVDRCVAVVLLKFWLLPVGTLHPRGGNVCRPPGLQPSPRQPKAP
jgi:hypothetical protein